jgi:phosphatidate phosphatase APP1
MAFIWHLTIVEMKDKLLVTGTVLKHKTSIDKQPKSILRNFWNVITSYQKKPYKNKFITLETQSKSFKIMTSKRGYFFEILPIKNLNDFKLYDHTHNELAIQQFHPVYFKNLETPIEVVSDIDDTVIHSHTASALKRIYTLLFKRPKRRKKVLFSNSLLDFLDENQLRIFYLSKSESNLFGLITSIFRFNEIPNGALFLTPYLKFKSLFKPKKGNHKLRFLHQLLTNLPDKNFILIGDDTQKDIDIYTQVVHAFRPQISKVYIRQTGFSIDEVQTKKWDALKQTGIPCTYFQDEDDIDLEIESLKQLINL